MTWELNVILALFLVPGPHSAGGTTGSADELPHPLLTENRSARVLKLVCKPPPDVKDWEKVYDLRLFGFLPQRRSSKNMSLAVVTSHAQEPRREEDVPDIAQVQFSGNWDTLSVSLSMLTPITGTELGDYFCTMQYGERGTTGNHQPTFSTKVSVQSLRPRPLSSENFEVSVIDAHEVIVTWRLPKAKFIQASVSSTLTDKDGGDATAGRTLFTTNGSDHFVYNSKVILAKFQSPSLDASNYSMRLYVDSELCYPYCRYSCDVPYKGCFGQDAKFCVCSQEDMGRSQVSTTQRDLHICVGVAVALLVLAVLIPVVLYCLFKTGKYRKFTCLTSLFKCLTKFVASVEKQDQLNSKETTSLLDKKQQEENEHPQNLPQGSPTFQESRGGTSRHKRQAEPLEQGNTQKESTPRDRTRASTPPGEGRHLNGEEDTKPGQTNEGQCVVVMLPESSAKSLNSHPPCPADPAEARNELIEVEQSGAVGGARFSEVEYDRFNLNERNETKFPSPVQSETEDPDQITVEGSKEPKGVAHRGHDVHPSEEDDQKEALLDKEATS